MDTLHPNWITEGIIDFEYKKYILLSYLQSTQKQFDDRKIYPFLSDLIHHQQNLVAIRDQKLRIEEQLPKEIKGIELSDYRIKYQPVEKHPDHLESIEQIIQFALPRINGQIRIAAEIYETAEHQIEIETVGIVPFYFNEGYLLFRTEGQSDTHVYAYELSIFESGNEQYRGLKTSYFESYPKTIYNYDEAIKADLIRKHRSLPNPATFSLYSKVNYPFQETIFPVAKRTFVRYLSQYKA